MNIGSNDNYPGCALSNFAAHRFEIDGIQCNSMEGFLQSLKFKSVEMQEEVCKLIGKAAKFKGKKKNWRTTQILYWRGIVYRRQGEEYQSLLDRAYNAMFEQSESFRNALKAAGKDANFTHSIGRNSKNETILTTSEFCARLMKLKYKLFNS